MPAEWELEDELEDEDLEEGEPDFEAIMQAREDAAYEAFGRKLEAMGAEPSWTQWDR